MLRALLILAALCQPAVAETIRIAVPAPYPPFQMRDAGGKVIGLDADILNEICRSGGHSCSWAQIPKAPLFDALQAGTVDVGASGFADTAKRARWVNMSCHYRPKRTYNVYFFGLTPDLDIRKHIIAVTQDTIEEEAAIKAGLRLRRYADIDLALQAMLDGEVAIFLGSKPFVRSYVDLNSLSQLGRMDATGRGTSFAVSYARPDIAKIIDDGLTELASDGTLISIRKKWLSKNWDDKTMPCDPAPSLS